jgi:periplasmic protein TonB
MERAAGLVIVMAMHAAVLWGLWQHRLMPGPQEAVTLFVNFIAPPAPPEKKDEPTPPPPAPKRPPRAAPIIAATSVVAPTEYLAPEPLPIPAPVIVAPPKPLGPVVLGVELSATCPERTPPSYPVASRRLGEQGVAVLRVELDELGKVSGARVATSSGFARLDEAALVAVRAWRCTPAQRDGQPVRGVALQPFNFILQGH